MLCDLVPTTGGPTAGILTPITSCSATLTSRAAFQSAVSQEAVEDLGVMLGGPSGRCGNRSLLFPIAPIKEDSMSHRRGHTPSVPQHKRRASRNRSLVFLLSSVLGGAMPVP